MVVSGELNNGREADSGQGVYKKMSDAGEEVQ